MERMRVIMEDLRKNAPDEICGKKVLWMSDHQASVKIRRRPAADPSALPNVGGIWFEGDNGRPLRYRAEKSRSTLW